MEIGLKAEFSLVTTQERVEWGNILVYHVMDIIEQRGDVPFSNDHERYIKPLKAQINLMINSSQSPFSELLPELLFNLDLHGTRVKNAFNGY